MSQPSSANKSESEAVQKQPLNVYTMMLIIAFIAISTACLLLYLELRRWGAPPWWNTSSVRAVSYNCGQTAPMEFPRLLKDASTGDRLA